MYRKIDINVYYDFMILAMYNNKLLKIKLLNN